MLSRKKTKIIATIGPSSEKEEILEKLINEGMDAARLNFSHGSHEEQGARIKTIRKLEKKLDRQIAIIADLQGPKLRVGIMPENGFELKQGEKVKLDANKKEFENNIIPIPSAVVRDGTKVGHIIFLDDGTLQLKVLKKTGSIFEAEVLKGGLLFSKKGINVPMLENESSILSAKDKSDLAFAVEAGVDYIALSFLRNANDVKMARKLLGDSSVKIIAKIERPEALRNLDEIAIEADAVMVARGDLGIETPLWELPVRQKEIVEQVRKKMKPVIVATQMLDSMIRNPLPTRAEVSDVANAVYDSADAVMLSGESASGKYPVEAVEMMRKVLEVTEKDQDDLPDICDEGVLSVVLSVARSAKYIATQVGARAIFAGTVTGTSSRAISFFRPKPQIIAITQDERVARELAIVWGVLPVTIKGKKVKTVEALLDYAVAVLKCDNSLCKEEKVIWISGEKAGVSGQTNTLSIRSIS